MNIIYHENPLNTVIHLDECEKQILWYKTKVEQMEYRLFSVHYNLAESRLNLKEARREADSSYYLDEDVNGNTPLDDRVDELVAWYIEALASSHVGDCTCVACSCEKCHAEELMGINTIPGLGKHEAHYIDIMFQEHNTIHEVLGALKNYEPPPSSGAKWELTTINRWKGEATGAYEWLYKYIHEHFSY
jgi:hypothetical protein